MDNQNYNQNELNGLDSLPLPKVENMHKPCLSLKSGCFPLVYCFVISNFIDKHDTKNLWRGGGGSLIKVGMDLWAQALGFPWVNFCLGIRFWEVKIAQALGFWQFLTIMCNI